LSVNSPLDKFFTYNIMACVQTANQILSVIQSVSGSYVITNGQFFDSFIRNTALVSTHQKRRFEGRRIKF